MCIRMLLTAEADAGYGGEVDVRRLRRRIQQRRSAARHAGGQAVIGRLRCRQLAQLPSQSRRHLYAILWQASVDFGSWRVIRWLSAAAVGAKNCMRPRGTPCVMVDSSAGEADSGLLNPPILLNAAATIALASRQEDYAISRNQFVGRLHQRGSRHFPRHHPVFAARPKKKSL
eukprot:scaffold46409_cov38-Prasinocladus_malaysianus.AAC.1